MVIPLIIMIVGKIMFPHEITWQESLISLGVTVLIAAAVVGAGYYRDSADTEIISGQVVSKDSQRVSCQHSYSCNCYTTCSGGKTRTCTQHCSTCYEHGYDISWYVRSDIGYLTIDRVNRRGDEMPPRWNAVQMGDPFSMHHGYTNWVKASPDSLFHAINSVAFEKLIPNYPRVYDYYKVDRAIAMGVTVPDLKSWQENLAIMQRIVGPKKQANVIVIFAKTSNRAYVEALKSKWLGGKKNDVLVVVGTLKYPKVEFVDVISWTDNQLFKIQLRDDLSATPEVNQAQWIESIQKNIMTSYVRKPAKDFEYLKDEIQPPTWVIALAFFLSFVVSCVATVVAHRHKIA